MTDIHHTLVQASHCVSCGKCSQLKKFLDILQVLMSQLVMPTQQFLLGFVQIVVQCVGHCVVFGEVCCWFIQAVGAHALRSWQVVDGIDDDIDRIFFRFVWIGLCCP